jgi:hypothetical protein
MKTKKKFKRYNFAFDERIDALLRKISEETDIQLTIIVERGIELFAEKKGVSL